MKKFLSDFIGFEKQDFIACSFLGLFSALLMLIFPIGVQTLVNSIAFTGLLQPIAVLSLVVFIILLNAYLSYALQSVTIEKIQRRIYARAVLGVVHYDRSKNLVGDDRFQLTRFLEIAGIQKSLAFLAVEGLTLILQLVTGISLLAIYHSALLMFGFGLLTAVIFVIWILLKPALHSSEKESTAKYNFMDQLLANPNLTDADVEKNSLSYLHARSKHFRFVFSQTVLLYGIATLAVTTLLGLGGYLVVVGQLSLGQLVAAELIVGTICLALSSLPKQLESFYDLSASLRKISRIYHAERAPETQLQQTFKQLKITPLNSAKIIWTVGGVLIAFFIGVAILPWQQTSFGTGKIVALDPAERPQTLKATIDGRISKWNVREGDVVEKNQLVVELMDLDPRTIERLEQQRENVHRQLKAIEISRDTANKNLQRQIGLEKEGIVAKRTLELARHDLAKVTKEEAGIFEKLAEIDMKIARQRAQAVASPTSGFVSQVYRGQGGDIVKKGDPLVTIVPRAPTRVAEIWVEGNDAPLVYPGRKARLQFEGWPAVQFSGFPKLALGTFEGRVRMVDWTDNGKGQFRILIEESEPNTWPHPNLLRQGVRVISWILLERVRVGYEIWRHINGFPPLRTEPPKDFVPAAYAMPEYE